MQKVFEKVKEDQPRLGCGVYADGKVDIGVNANFAFGCTLEQWRATNKLVEDLAAHQNL